MKTEEIQDRLERGYTIAIYGTRENIHKQMTNDISELLRIGGVSQQRELLKAYAELIQSDYTTHFFDDAVEESIDEFLSL